MAMPVDSTAQEFVRLKFCPDCGYRLEGLATDGRCPECGAQYTSQDIVLYGWKERVDKVSMIFGLGTSVCGAVGLIIGGVIIMMAPGSDQIGWLIVIIGIIVLGTTIWRWYRINEAIGESAGPWQLRLVPRGYALRYGPGTAKLTDWGPKMTVRFESSIDGFCAIHIAHELNVASWKLSLSAVPVEKARIFVQADLENLKPVIERVAMWLGSRARRPNYRQIVIQSKLEHFGAK